MTGSVRDEGVVLLVMPHPPASLSPNSRDGWWDRARAAKGMRLYAKTASQAVMRYAGIDEPWTAARMDILWRFAGKQPDDDNVIARLKSTRDGIADAGLVADDSMIQVGAVTFERVPRKDVCVVLTLTRLEASK